MAQLKQPQHVELLGAVHLQYRGRQLCLLMGTCRDCVNGQSASTVRTSIAPGASKARNPMYVCTFVRMYVCIYVQAHPICMFGKPNLLP